MIELNQILIESNGIKIKHYKTAIAVIHCCGAFFIMVKSEIKGYKLSTDYKKLWDLIQQGHRIPAWIIYSKEYKEPIYDLVEVKMAYMSDRYSIGVRGHGYDTLDSDFKSFEMNCKSLELRWVVL